MNHNVSHLNFFCCVTYSHVLDELRKKLDKEGQNFIFVGYSEETKTYKLYDLVTRKVIISCDVQFVENEAWDGTLSNNVKIVSIVKHGEMAEEMVQTPNVSKIFAASSTPKIA